MAKKTKTKEEAIDEELDLLEEEEGEEEPTLPGEEDDLEDEEDEEEEDEEEGPNYIPMFKIGNLPIFCVTDLPSIDTDEFKHFVLVAADGLFEIKHTPYGALSRKVTGISTKNQDEYMGETFVPSFPKLPMRLIGQVAAFFHAVFKKHQAEAVVLIFLNRKTSKWTVYVPTQEVSGATADYSIEEEIVDDKELKALMANGDVQEMGTIHSHASMGAGHSSTDDNDEIDRDGIHITFGSFTHSGLSGMSHSFSFMWKGTRFKLKPEDVVAGWKEPGNFPKRWVEKVSKKSYAGGSTTTFPKTITGAGNSSGKDATKPKTDDKDTNNEDTKTDLKLCNYSHMKFHCIEPATGLGKCRFHDLSTYREKQMNDAETFTLVECECEALYFEEVGTSCYEKTCNIKSSKSYKKELWELLVQAGLEPGSLLSLGEHLVTNLLNDLELIATKQTSSKKRILSANFLVQEILAEIRVALLRLP